MKFKSRELYTEVLVVRAAPSEIKVLRKAAKLLKFTLSRTIVELAVYEAKKFMMKAYAGKGPNKSTCA